MGLDWVGWDLCVGLFYEHRFAMLKMSTGEGGGGRGVSEALVDIVY